MPSHDPRPGLGPSVVPAPRSWSPSGGRLPATTAFDVAPCPVARLADDVAAILRPAGSGEPGAEQPGEVTSVRLVVDEGLTLPVSSPEGYRLQVDDVVTITGRTEDAVRRGATTLAQLASGGEPLPRGTVEDWPDYPVRGFLLDVGRRFVPIAALRDLVRIMSWYRLNTLVVHLNDNEIAKDTGRAWADAQHGFRLRSDDARWAPLASADGAYDRADWDSLEEVARSVGVTVVPELDAPAHSRSLIALHPELGLDGGDSDMLDLGNPATLTTVTALVEHFLPWFRSDVVHIGADEYREDLREDFRTYVNTMVATLRAHGRRAMAWGSLERMAAGAGTAPADGFDTDVTILAWNNEWYSPRTALADGFEVVNTNDTVLYTVPFADYYRGTGLDGRAIWETWAPHVFPDGQSLAPQAPGLRGAIAALWNDLVLKDYDTHTMMRMILPTLGVLAQKTWSSATPDLDYGTVARVLVQHPPRVEHEHVRPTVAVPDGERAGAVSPAADASAAREVAIGVDVGGTTIKLAVVDGLGRRYGEHTVPTPREVPALVAAVVDGVRSFDALAQALTGSREPLPVGVVVPGIVDEPAGVAVMSANLGWRDVPLAKLLTDALGTPVALGHDVRAATLAEHRWGSGSDTMLFVALGTGIASGLVVDRVLVQGDGYAGEIGQLGVRTRDGSALVPLEHLASATRIAERYRAQVPGEADTAQVLARAAEGDAVARSVVDEAVSALADVLAGHVGLLGPVRIVVGGGLSAAGDVFLGPLRSALASRMTVAPAPEVVAATLGSWAGCLGAAMIAGGRSATPDALPEAGERTPGGLPTG